MDQQIWLDLPCPTCGDYALEAEVVLRDVSLTVHPLEGGRLSVVVHNADAHLAAAVCHACGEEPDAGHDDQIAEALEAAAESWLGRAPA